MRPAASQLATFVLRAQLSSSESKLQLSFRETGMNMHELRPKGWSKKLKISRREKQCSRRALDVHSSAGAC